MSDVFGSVTLFRRLGPLIALLLAAPPALAQGAGGPPPAVVVAAAEMTEMEASTTFSGRLVAAQKVDLRARVTGYLYEQNFREGQRVAAGDTLFVIEDDVYTATVAEVDGQIQAAEAELKLAELERERTARLTERGTLSQADLDRAEAAVGQATGNLARLQAQRRQAEINLSYTRLQAPFDGVTGLSSYDVGAFITPDGGPLVTVTALDPIFVEFPVTTAAFLRLRNEAPVGEAPQQARDGARITLRLPDGSVYDREGTANFINPEVDAGTDTILVRAVFENPDYMLPDGGLVQVLVAEADARLRLAIPAQAVQRDLAGSFVMVVLPDDTVEQRRVDTGLSRLGLTEIVSGLDEGELVITEGINKVRPGIAVDAAVAGSE